MKNSGAATLIFTISLLILSTLIIFFATNVERMYDKTTINLTRNAQAFRAAEAGLEFGINYLQKNSAIILANPVSGFIPAYSDSSTSNVTLANNSKFTLVYTNPIANNYTLIQITSTGTNDDGTATQTIRQQVQLGSLFVNIPNAALTSKGAVNMSGNSMIGNTNTDQTIIAASTINISGNGHTEISTGTGSNASHIGSDIQSNQSSLANMSQNDFFASFFGTTSTSTIQSKAAYQYSNASNTNYSSTLNGKAGAAIWIDQLNGTTASINGNTTIGSATSPVLLIVNGSLSLSGNVTIYGFIFIIGTTGITSITGNLELHGGLASTANISMSGNSNLNYSPTILTDLQKQPSISYFAKVAGTWRND